MLTNRKTLIPFIVATLILIAAGVGLAVNFFINNSPSEPTEPTQSSPTPNPSEPALPSATHGEGYDLESYLDSEQYQTGSISALTAYFENADIGFLDPAFLALSASTIDRYVENSIANQYFVSDFWGQEDNYRVDSLKSYLTPLMSEEYAKEFTSSAEKGVDSEGFFDFYNPKLHLLSEGLTASEACQETFSEDACFYAPFEYQNATFSNVEGSQTQISVTVDVKTFPVYQHPDYTDGNTAYETRSYKLSFVLELETGELDGKIDTSPIMRIVSVDGSLEIEGIDDFIVMDFSETENDEDDS